MIHFDLQILKVSDEEARDLNDLIPVCLLVASHKLEKGVDMDFEVDLKTYLKHSVEVGELEKKLQPESLLSQIEEILLM
jgi:hypothetical protein